MNAARFVLSYNFDQNYSCAVMDDLEIRRNQQRISHHGDAASSGRRDELAADLRAHLCSQQLGRTKLRIMVATQRGTTIGPVVKTPSK